MNQPTQRQTVTYLIKRFAESGVHIKHRHGQNFLIDLNLMQLIVDSAQVDGSDVVLEVGTGAGALTSLIAQRAAAVVTVEIDPHMHQLASEELFERSNVTMLQQDALRNKNAFAPEVIAAVQKQLAAAPNLRLKLVSNLPYNVATPVISNLLRCPLEPYSMTATIQKELADRMAAVPGTRDYGALSVWMQSQCQMEVVRILPPTVFWPKPKVTSAIVHALVDAPRRAAIADREFFHHFVRALFFHRRKLLRGVVQAACKSLLSKVEVDEAIGELNLAADARAEQLDVPTLLKLAEVVRGKLPVEALASQQVAGVTQDLADEDSLADDLSGEDSIAEDLSTQDFIDNDPARNSAPVEGDALD